MYTKGGDYGPATGKQPPEAAVVEAHGGKVVYLPYVSDHSTTLLLQRILREMPRCPRRRLTPRLQRRRLGASDLGLARSAGILGIGNVASRLLGLARETIISGYFGSSGELSAFNLAARVPTILYDLVVGGMLSAALVPVFSDYSRPERRGQLATVAGAIFSLIAVLMSLLLLLLELFAEPVAAILGDFEDPALHRVLVESLRILAPAVVVLGLAGGITGLLYATQRFTYTAISGAAFNLGIVIMAPLLAPSIGITALPLGILAGSLIQIGVLIPGLRGLGIRPSLAWEHPGVRRILHLYVPIALGLLVTNFQIIVDGRWASASGEQSVSWMRYATTLTQLPLGLVPVAVSLAALPGLSQRAAAGDWTGFRSLFARGLRLVLVLLLPAIVALWVLAEPVVRMLFEHGSFSAADTQMTAVALRLYLLGLGFAGVDFMLNYSFYARQDTRTPALVGVLAVFAYFAAAVLLLPLYGFLGLVLADSVKQAAHALIMIFLLGHSIGWLRGERILTTALRSGAAAVALALVAGGAVALLARVSLPREPSGQRSWLPLRAAPAPAPTC